jgi:hypothetical protein
MAKALVVDMLQTHGFLRAAAVECVQFYWILTVLYVWARTTTWIQVCPIVERSRTNSNSTFLELYVCNLTALRDHPQGPYRLWCTPRNRRVNLTAISILWWHPIKPCGKVHTLVVKYTPSDYFLKVHLLITSHLTLCRANVILPSGILNKTYEILIFHVRSICLVHLVLNFLTPEGNYFVIETCSAYRIKTRLCLTEIIFVYSDLSKIFLSTFLIFPLYYVLIFF